MSNTDRDRFVDETHEELPDEVAFGSGLIDNSQTPGGTERTVTSFGEKLAPLTDDDTDDDSSSAREDRIPGSLATPNLGIHVMEDREH